MNHKIKFVLLALGLGVFVGTVHASCGECDDSNANGVCDYLENEDESDSMPKVLIDDMPTSAFSDELVEPAAISVAK
jgi:hypothetical protein